jgi:hypothetical protein
MAYGNTAAYDAMGSLIWQPGGAAPTDVERAAILRDNPNFFGSPNTEAIAPAAAPAPAITPYVRPASFPHWSPDDPFWGGATFYEPTPAGPKVQNDSGIWEESYPAQPAQFIKQYGDVNEGYAYSLDPETGTITPRSWGGGGGWEGTLGGILSGLSAIPGMDKVSDALRFIGEIPAQAGEVVGAALKTGGVNEGQTVQDVFRSPAAKKLLGAVATYYAAPYIAATTGLGEAAAGPSQVPSSVFNTGVPFAVDPTLAPTFQSAFTVPESLAPGTTLAANAPHVANASLALSEGPTAAGIVPEYILPNAELAPPAPPVAPTPFQVDPSLGLPGPTPTPVEPAQPFTTEPAFKTPTIGQASGKMPLGGGGPFTTKQYLEPPEPTEGYTFSDEKSFPVDMSLYPDYPPWSLIEGFPSSISDLIGYGQWAARLLGLYAAASPGGGGGDPSTSYSWTKRGSLTPDNTEEYIGRMADTGKSKGLVAGAAAEEADPISIAYALSNTQRYNPSLLYYK